MSNTCACEEKDTKQGERRVPGMIGMSEGGDGGHDDTSVGQGLVGQRTGDEQPSSRQSDTEMHGDGD